VRWAALALGLAAASCAGAPPDVPLPAAVERLVGEVHLHQFPAGSHAWAGFPEAPVAVGDVHGDQLFEIDDPIAAAEGACVLFVQPSCAAGCAGASYCAAADRCAPLPHVVDVDGGEVDATGSSLQPAIRMWFAGADSTYASEPPPGPANLFAGGEELVVTDGTLGFAFRARVEAPAPMVVTSPDLTQPDVALSGALALRWTPGGADQVVVVLSDSAHDGEAAWVRCVTADLGELDVPASLIGALPPAPRDLRIEVERDQERLVPVARDGASGLGVLLHASFTAWKNWSE
jgi:hypothetical protein